ncbi:MAG: DUF465 domain-containing protein [Myxococcales bacterium]|jgi:hypothetical protein|nr:MAG: DUF465 domain-containing protein [Myxococcales bacterium]
MEQHEEQKVAALIPHNPDLKAAYEEHQELKEQVHILQAKAFLSPEEELEKKRLQKLKLVAKTKVLHLIDELAGG